MITKLNIKKISTSQVNVNIIYFLYLYLFTE